MDERIQVILEAKDLMSGEVRRITGELTGFEKAQGRVGTATIALGTALGHLAHDAIRGVFSAIGDAIGEVVAFERAMLNVNSIAKVGAGDFAEMKDAVLDLSTVVPQSAATLAEGLYDIQSSGFAGREGIEVLDAAARAASAGLTTTASSAKGLTAILNAYGYGADQAGRISDIMFKTVDRGVISFDELAGEIGKSTALAAPLGVEIEEVAGAIALMTRKGIDGANATTQLNAIMQTLLKPSNEAVALAAELGLGWDSQALAARGLNGVLADMIEKTGGSHEQMATLLGNARAIRGAFVLGADGGGELTREIEAMGNAAGATDTALSYQKQGLAYNMGILGNQVDAAAIRIGDRLLPMITELVQGLSDWLRENEHVVDAIGDGLVVVVGALADALGAVFAVMGPVVEVLRHAAPAASGVAVAIGVALIPSVIGLAVAIGGLALAAAPFLVIAGAVAALVAGMQVLDDALDPVILSINDVEQALQGLSDRTGASVDEIAAYMADYGEHTDATFDEALAAAQLHFGLDMPKAAEALSKVPITADRHLKVYEGELYNHMLAAKGIVQTGVDGQVEAIANMPETAADAMLANQFHLTGPDGAIAELVKFMGEALDPAQELFNAHAFLNSQAYRDGLASGIPAVVKKTQEMGDEAHAVISAYSAFGPGYRVGTSFGDGMSAAYGYVRTAAGTLAAAARGQIGINSEPSDFDSALRGITSWGGNAARTVAAGMISALGEVRAAAGELGSAMVPAMVPAMVAGTSMVAWPGAGSAMPGAGAGGGDGITINLHVDRFYGTEDGIRDISRQLGRELRLAVGPMRAGSQL